MKKALLIVVFIALCRAFAVASDLQIIIAQANDAYSKGLYANAAQLYEKILKSGYESPELYYNLGNTYYKMNDYAPAILNYERARRLDPGNEDINFNLQVANSRIADKIEPLPALFYKRWYDSLINLLSPDSWAKAGIGVFIGALLLGLLYFLSRLLILRKIGFWAGLLLLVMSLFFTLFAWQTHNSIYNREDAIVFDPTVTVKSSPDDKSVDLFVLHEGTKVRIIDNIGTWYEIRIANGSVGWLPDTAIEKI